MAEKWHHIISATTVRDGGPDSQRNLAFCGVRFAPRIHPPVGEDGRSGMYGGYWDGNGATCVACVDQYNETYANAWPPRKPITAG
jgi:hypothetical protein